MEFGVLDEVLECRRKCWNSGGCAGVRSAGGSAGVLVDVLAFRLLEVVLECWRKCWSSGLSAGVLEDVMEFGIAGVL